MSIFENSNLQKLFPPENRLVIESGSVQVTLIHVYFFSLLEEQLIDALVPLLTGFFSSKTIVCYATFESRNWWQYWDASMKCRRKIKVLATIATAIKPSVSHLINYISLFFSHFRHETKRADGKRFVTLSHVFRQSSSEKWFLEGFSKSSIFFAPLKICQVYAVSANWGRHLKRGSKCN